MNALNSPDIVIAIARDTGVDPFVEAIVSHPSIGLLGQQDFTFAEGDCETFPLKSHHPEFTDHTEYASAFDTLNDRLIQTHSHVAWVPPGFFEFAHVQWTTTRNLPNARYVFCLRNPVDAVQVRYDSHRVEFEDNLTTAIARCESEMEEIGKFTNRGRWDKYFAEPTEISLLLQCACYAPAIARCLRLVPKEQINVVLFEDFIAAPHDVCTRVYDFLGLPETEQQPLDVPAAAALHVSDHDTLRGFYTQFNQQLADVLGWEAVPWQNARVN